MITPANASPSHSSSNVAARDRRTPKADCVLGNIVLPGVIRDVCERRELPWGHDSSGCIYTDSRSDGGGFCESDAPNFTFRHNNCSFYSGCKALGEELLKETDNRYVWRLRIPFNHVDSSRNYLSKLMRYTRLLDVRISLSHLDEFVEACLDCWQNRLDMGIYNLTCTGSITTREIVEIIRRSGLCDKRTCRMGQERWDLNPHPFRALDFESFPKVQKRG